MCRAAGTTVGTKLRLTRTFLMAMIVTCIGCGSPPQVVDNDECFQAVDALWTAVTSKRSDLLEQTVTELERLRSAGALSEDGHQALSKIVGKARAAEWPEAAKMLKVFMLGQMKTAP